VPVPDREFDKRQMLAFEREMLGLYVSDHPLMGAEASLRRRTDTGLAELDSVEDGSVRTVGGLVTGLQRKYTRKGDLMAVFTLEDLQSSAEVMVFPKTMSTHGHVLAEDAVVVVRAKVDRRDEQPKLVALEIEAFEPLSDVAHPIRIRLSPNALNPTVLAELRQLLTEHPGESEVFLHVGDHRVLRLPSEFNAEASTGLMGELRVLLGPGAIVG
jgi:DNA polymerase III subunit alpha